MIMDFKNMNEKQKIGVFIREAFKNGIVPIDGDCDGHRHTRPLCT